MDERELRRIDPRNYPDELKQTVYHMKDCLKLRNKVKSELEHAKTYRKKALETTLLELEKTIELGLDVIGKKKITEKQDQKLTVGEKIVSAVVSGEIRRVEIKKEEGE